MDPTPDRQSMGGPQRSGPSGRGPRGSSEPVGGGAYTAPPPARDVSGPADRKRSGGWWIALVLAAAVAGGAYVYKSSGVTQAPEATTAAAAAVASLTLATADLDRPATEMARKLIAAGAVPKPDGTAVAKAADSAAAVAAPVMAPVVHRPKPAPDAAPASGPAPAPAAETELAVRQMVAQAPPEVLTSIANGSTSIYSLHVVDDVAEDGDVVEVFVNGQTYGLVSLSNAGQDMLLALPAGSTNYIRALAREDGGGGVTFGVLTSAGELRSTVMSVGESDNWSVVIP